MTQSTWEWLLCAGQAENSDAEQLEHCTEHWQLPWFAHSPGDVLEAMLEPPLPTRDERPAPGTSTSAALLHPPSVGRWYERLD